MYYLFITALLSYFVGEYAAFPMRPAALAGQTLPDIFMRMAMMAASCFALSGLFHGYWGLLLGAALWVLHVAVDLLTRPFFNMVSGRRLLLTLADLALHVVAMFVSAVLLSFFAEPITPAAAVLLRAAGAAAMGVFFYPVLAKTLLLDAFPRYYSERALFAGWEWPADAALGAASALSCALLPWWIALVCTGLFMAGALWLGRRFEKDRPVLVLAKIGVLMLLLPCFLLIFRG